MDTSNIISVILIIVAGLIGWFVARSGKPQVEIPVIPGEDPLITEARRKEAEANAALAEAQTVTSVALTGAQMAEQLWRSGKIPRDERSQTALDYVLKVLADKNIHVEKEQLIKNIEAGVLIVNTLTAVLPKIIADTSGPATGIPNPPTSFKPTGG